MTPPTSDCLTISNRQRRPPPTPQPAPPRPDPPRLGPPRPDPPRPGPPRPAPPIVQAMFQNVSLVSGTPSPFHFQAIVGACVPFQRVRPDARGGQSLPGPHSASAMVAVAARGRPSPRSRPRRESTTTAYRVGSSSEEKKTTLLVAPAFEPEIFSWYGTTRPVIANDCHRFKYCLQRGKYPLLLVHYYPDNPALRYSTALE